MDLTLGTVGELVRPPHWRRNEKADLHHAGGELLHIAEADDGCPWMMKTTSRSPAVKDSQMMRANSPHQTGTAMTTTG